MKQTKTARKNKNNRSKKVIGGVESSTAFVIAFNLMAVGYMLYTNPEMQRMYMNTIYPMANKLERQIGEGKVSLKRVLNEQNTRKSRSDFREFPKSMENFLSSVEDHIPSRKSMANSAKNMPRDVSLKDNPVNLQGVKKESTEESMGTRRTRKSSSNGPRG